jgi:hypothetical protein
MKDLNSKLLVALADADDRRKEAALRLLQGKDVADTVTQSGHEPFLTLRETSKRLGPSVSSLARWNIPGHGLAGRTRYKIPEVVKYLESDAFKRHAEKLKKERLARRGAQWSGQSTITRKEAER